MQLSCLFFLNSKILYDNQINLCIFFNLLQICSNEDVKVVLNGQTFEPFDSAFNAVNMSYIQIKNTIRQARCAGFKNKFDLKENSLPFRKEEVSTDF